MKKNNNKKVKKTPYEIKQNTSYFVKNRLPAFVLAGFIIFWTIASIFGIIAYARTKKEDNQGLITASAEDIMTLTRTEVDLLHFNGMTVPFSVNGVIVPYTLMSNLSFGVIQANGNFRPYIRVVNSGGESDRRYYFSENDGSTEARVSVLGYPTNSFNDQDLVLASVNIIFVLSTDWDFQDLYNYFPFNCSVDFLNDIYESGYAPSGQYSGLSSALSFVKESPYASDNYLNPHMVYLDMVLPYMDGDGFTTCPFLSNYVEEVSQEENIGIYVFRSINNAQYFAEIADKTYISTDLESLRLEYNDLLVRYNGIKQELDSFDLEYQEMVSSYEQRLADLQARINSAYSEGKSDGYQNGYEVGVIAGASTANEYTFDGLLSAVIDVPIRTFRSLFNFELLGINLANFFLSLLTVCVILAVVRWIM